MTMNPQDRASIITRHEDMRSIRAPEEGEWQEIGDVLQPEGNGIRSATSRTRYGDLLDSTQLYAHDNFVGGIFGQLTNPANRWIELGSDDPELNAWGPVKMHLYTSTSILLSSLGPAVSAFYQEIAGSFGDIGCYGMGTMMQEEEQGKQRIIDRVVPISQSYIDVDAHGEVDRFHREFELKGRQLKGWWGHVPDVQDDRSYKLIHSTWQDQNWQPGRIGPEHLPVKSVYVSPDLPSLCRVGGYWEFPYHVARWKKRGHTPYATGPGHAARPDIAMLQEMERAHIVAAQFAAQPMLMAHNDAVLNTSDLVPDAILYGTITENGKQLLQPMNRNASLQLSMEQSKQRRDAIRDAFYFGLMQLMQRPQMTATEFLGFQEEKLRLMGPNLTRIQLMLSGLIKRRFGILNRAGQLPEPPAELKGRRLEVIYQSPLAKAQQASTARAAMNFFNTTMQIAQVEPEALDVMDADAILAVVHEGLGAPPSVMRDPRLVQQRRQQRAQAQQQSVALEQAGQAVQIAAEAAHAQQAGTLAKTRGNAA